MRGWLRVAHGAAARARRTSMSSLRPVVNATVADALDASSSASSRLGFFRHVRLVSLAKHPQLAGTPSHDGRRNSTNRARLGLAVASGAAALIANAARSEVKADDRSHELSGEEQKTIALFERCSGSVVHINTFVKEKGLVPGAWGGLQMDLQEIQQGTGSGFMWDSKHIVTNYHVIKDADKATIVFADHTSREAILVGVEPDFDLAVLRFDNPDGLLVEPLSTGSSSRLQVGQKVFAIGNPFGLDQTLTSGIVSGLGREMRRTTAAVQS